MRALRVYGLGTEPMSFIFAVEEWGWTIGNGGLYTRASCAGGLRGAAW
jgi:hypothetical protein